MSAQAFKKIFSLLLSTLVFGITTLSILAIWDIVKVEDILGRAFSSLVVIFIASAVILFIFTVLYPVGAKKNNQDAPRNPSQNESNKNS